MYKKIIGILICTLFIGTSFNIMPNITTTVKADITTGLVAYWNFNEGSGTIAHDSSGNGNDGTIYGATWTTGILGSGLYFDGSNDYVQVASPVLNVPPYSVCAWVKASSLPVSTDDDYILNNGGQTRNSYGFFLTLAGQPFQCWMFGAAIQGGNQLQYAYSPASTGTWYFLVGTWDGSPNSNHLKLYVNGAPIGTYGSGGPWPTGPAENLRMGAPSNTINYFYNGILDEARIYNRVLSDSEIQTLYNQGSQNTPPNPPTNPDPFPGATGIDTNAELSWSCSDPDGDPLTYDVYFGTNSNPTLVSTGQTENSYKPATMDYTTTYHWRIVAKDNRGGSTSGPIWFFTTTDQPNNPPNTPRKPSGPGGGWTGMTLVGFSTNATDPDNDQIKYGWDWNGDDNVEQWSGLLPSGSTCTENHKWDSPGTYYIKVKAMDSKGAVSSWSDAKTVTITDRNKLPNMPSFPNPSEGATDVDVNANLSWIGGDPDSGDTVTYDIYFGILSDPPFMKSVTSTSYDPGSMNINTKYYWKIVAKDNHGNSATSPVWDFTTGSGNQNPYAPSNPSPADQATGVDINADLSWIGGDPDSGDTVTYDIYFGTSTNPPIVPPRQSGTSINPGTMILNTKYYWKIVAWDNHGSNTTGPIWDFTTKPGSVKPIAEIKDISPDIAGVKNPSGLNARDDPITFKGNGIPSTGKTITKYIWKYNNKIIPDSNKTEFSTADLPVGKYSISLIVVENDGLQSAEVFWPSKIEIVDGLVFRPPFENVQGMVQTGQSVHDINNDALVEEINGDGLIAKAYRNVDRGDVYVYSYGDTGFTHLDQTCYAQAGQFVTFSTDSSTKYISLSVKFHTIGGTRGNCPFGQVTTSGGFQSYDKVLSDPITWYSMNYGSKDIDPPVGALDVLMSLFGPISAILNLPAKISTFLELILDMSSAKITDLSYNQMLEQLQDTNSYTTLNYTEQEIQTSNSGEHALMVFMRSGFTGAWIGVGEACRIGLIENIIIKKTKPQSCFPAGTKITMADGNTKNIEDIKVGDKILSYDIEKNIFANWTVRVTERRDNYSYYEINKGLICPSNAHPFFIKKQDGRTGWGSVMKLEKNMIRISNEPLQIEVGDQLFTVDQKWITVNNITYHPGPTKLYNILSYTGDKNYFANGMLVYEDYIKLSYLIQQIFKTSTNPLKDIVKFFKEGNYKFLP